MSKLQIGGDEEPGELGKIQRREDQIRFSVSPARFVEILEDIMGPKEELKWAENFAFVARKEDLAQFHHLLQYKISTASRATLSLFSAEVSYSDGTNRSINTFASLERLYEHNNVKATAFSMRWEVLMDLGSERPLQRQVVRLDLTTDGSKRTVPETTAAVRIEHTSALWANEVLTIFRNQLEKIAVRYSVLYVASQWYSKHLRSPLLTIAFFLSLGLGGFYLASGRAAEDYFSPDEQIAYALSRGVGKAESGRKAEVLAQYTFVLYVLSHQNARVTESLIGRLRSLDYFAPEMEDVFSRIERGDFDRPILHNSGLRQAFVTAVVILVFLATLSALVAVYLRLYRSPGFLLLTDPSTSDYSSFQESRSRGREIAYHVLAVAVATACGKVASSLLGLGALILPP